MDHSFQFAVPFAIREKKLHLTQTFSNARIESLPAQNRLSLLETLCDGSKDDPETLEAIVRLLQYAPYPKTMEKYDVKIAKRFHRLWQDSLSAKRGYFAPNALKLFKTYCGLAMQAMELDPADITMSFRIVDLSKQARSRATDKTIAQVVHEAHIQDRYNARYELNSQRDLWSTRTLKWQQKLEIAQAALHETTHVRQFMGPDPKALSGFYETMLQEYRTLESCIDQDAVYRCSLVERQAYLRSEAFEDIARGFAARPERLYMDRYLHREMLKKAAESIAATFRPRMATLKPAV